MVSSSGLCTALLHALNERTVGDLPGLSRTVAAPEHVVLKALDLLVACHEICVTGSGADRLYLRHP